MEKDFRDLIKGVASPIKKQSLPLENVENEAEAKIEEDFVESAVVVPAEDRHLLPLLRDLAVDLDALEAVHQLTFH